jgi:hypothetical protein
MEPREAAAGRGGASEPSALRRPRRRRKFAPTPEEGRLRKNMSRRAKDFPPLFAGESGMGLPVVAPWRDVRSCISVKGQPYA